MEIRILGAGDEALLDRAAELADEGPLDAGRAVAHLADANLVCVVAIQSGEVAGFVYGHVLRRFEATSFFIYSVDVDAALQRRAGAAPPRLARIDR